MSVLCVKLNGLAKFSHNEPNVAEMVKVCFGTSETNVFHTLVIKAKETKD